MRVFGMGMPELLIILAVILLIFGPKNLPKLGSALGKTVKNLREGIGGSKAAEAEEEVEEVELIEEAEEQPVKRTVKTVKKKAPSPDTVD